MRKLYKVGSVTFALGVLGTAMVHAGMTACASREAANPETTVKSSGAPSAEGEEVEYFPATKSGAIMPRKRHDQQQAKGQ
jgi:hypothetical protein